MDEESEFLTLKNLLEELELYERGMGLEDMRQIQQAINESIDSASEDDLQAALRESENMANSSQFSQRSTNSIEDIGHYSYSRLTSSPPSSPDSPKNFTVSADIHAEQEYSPILKKRDQQLNQKEELRGGAKNSKEQHELRSHFEDENEISFFDESIEI